MWPGTPFELGYGIADVCEQGRLGDEEATHAYPTRFGPQQGASRRIAAVPHRGWVEGRGSWSLKQCEAHRRVQGDRESRVGMGSLGGKGRRSLRGLTREEVAHKERLEKGAIVEKGGGMGERE